MSAKTNSRVGNGWSRCHAWRGQRPFWAGLLTILAAGPIAYFPYAPVGQGGLTLAMATVAAVPSLLISVLLVVLGLSMWFQAVVRVYAGAGVIVLSLASPVLPVVSNLVGFLVAHLPGLIGGALAVAWTPVADPGPQPAEKPNGDAGGRQPGQIRAAAARPREHDGTVEANGKHSTG